MVSNSDNPLKISSPVTSSSVSFSSVFSVTGDKVVDGETGDDGVGLLVTSSVVVVVVVLLFLWVVDVELR